MKWLWAGLLWLGAASTAAAQVPDGVDPHLPVLGGAVFDGAAPADVEAAIAYFEGVAAERGFAGVAPLLFFDPDGDGTEVYYYGNLAARRLLSDPALVDLAPLEKAFLYEIFFAETFGFAMPDFGADWEWCFLRDALGLQYDALRAAETLSDEDRARLSAINGFALMEAFNAGAKFRAQQRILADEPTPLWSENDEPPADMIRAVATFEYVQGTINADGSGVENGFIAMDLLTGAEIPADRLEEALDGLSPEERAALDGARDFWRAFLEEYAAGGVATFEDAKARYCRS